MAPRLCGSEISSAMMMNGFSPFSSARAKMSSTVAYPWAATLAMTPWWFAFPHMKPSFFGSVSLMRMPASRAVAMIFPMDPCFSPRDT